MMPKDAAGKVNVPSVERDEVSGRFLQGNSLWRARSSAGPKPKFACPEHLWNACVEYFEWVAANPLYENKLVTFQGEATLVSVPKNEGHDYCWAMRLFGYRALDLERLARQPPRFVGSH